MIRLILYAYLTLSFVGSFAQNVVEEKIQIDTTFETIRVIYKPDVQTTYYYKKIAVFADDTSQVAIEKSYNKFGQNGLYQVYYPTGRLKIKTVFANNKINGEWTYYGLDGIIITKGVYRDGVKHGYWAYKSLRIYGRYKKGLKNRKWKRFDKNEKKYLSHYKDGKLTGGEGFGNEQPIYTYKVDTVKEEPKSVQKDTTLQEAINTKVGKEYEQAISFLITNTLFRRNAKAYFGGKVKKYFKNDRFQFSISPNITNHNIDYFIEQSESGKLVVANIDSLIKNNVEVLKQSFNGEEIKIDDALMNNSTNLQSPLKVTFSEVKNNFLRINVNWNNEGETKKFMLLLYFNNEGILKGAEYQKP